MFFVCLDLCHTIVERQRQLRQLISSFQGLGSEADLLYPAPLKVVSNGRVQIFTSEIKAQEYLKEIKEG